MTKIYSRKRKIQDLHNAGCYSRSGGNPQKQSFLDPRLREGDSKQEPVSSVFLSIAFLLPLSILGLFIITPNLSSSIAKPTTEKGQIASSSLKTMFNKLKHSSVSITNLQELKQLFQTPELNLTKQRIEKDGLIKVARDMLENPHLGTILSQPIHIKNGRKPAFLVIPSLVNRFGNGDPFQFNNEISGAEDVLLFQYLDPNTQQNQDLTLYALLYVILDQADQMIQEGNRNPHFLHNTKIFNNLYRLLLPLKTIITPIGSKKLSNKRSTVSHPTLRSPFREQELNN
jgi:hypothetical protein